MKISTNTYLVIAIVSAFVSVISFFNVNSYWADKNHLNGVVVGAGIVFAIVTIFAGYKCWYQWGSTE